MVSPGFGWSAGDIVASIHIIIKICQAFKEAGGATSQYKDNIAFLEGFNITLSRLDSCIGRNPDSEYAAEISEWLKLVNAPYSKFEKFLLEFKPALGSASTFSKFRKVPKKIKWAWKELSAVSSKVAELKREVCDPLMLLDTLLQMQSIKMLEDISKEVSKLPRSSQIETIMTSFKDTTAQSLTVIESHINDLINRSTTQDHGQQVALQVPADRTVAKRETYKTESNPKMAWLGPLATQIISTGISSVISGAIPIPTPIPLSVNTTIAKFNFK